MTRKNFEELVLAKIEMEPARAIYGWSEDHSKPVKVIKDYPKFDQVKFADGRVRQLSEVELWIA